MKIQIKHFIKSLFVIFFLLNIAGIIAVAAIPQQTKADDNALNYNSNVKIGDFKGGAVGKIEGDYLNVDILPRYIQAIYMYATGIVGILATIVLMYGGFTWITSAGSADRVADAKAWIASALTGLLLVLFSYTILYMINPALVQFKPLKIQVTTKTPKGGEVCCDNTGNFVANKDDGTCQSTCNDFCSLPEIKESYGNYKCANVGYCYSGKCYFGDGEKENEPCGNEKGGICEYDCSDERIRERGGRDCGKGINDQDLVCCQ